MKFAINAPQQPKDLFVTLVLGGGERFVVTPRKKMLVLGIDEKEKVTLRDLRLLVRKAVKIVKAQKEEKMVFSVSEWNFSKEKISETESLELIVTNVLLADYTFDYYKTPPKGGFPRIKEVNLVGVKDVVLAREVLRRAEITAEETNAARTIANYPAGDMTPAILARHTQQIFRNLPVDVTLWNEQRLVRENMAAILAVGKGSQAKPRFIIVEYHGGKKSESPIILIGKGVTFDSGGINLKPSQGILGMHMDMSGAATVLHTLAALVRLKIKKNIIVLVPAVENMISGESYRPGDIIRTASGKTIEVQNTDAEGRIILSDALHVAKRYKPILVIDVATLTGASMVALGERATALFATDEEMELTLRHIGFQVGDPVWPLPLWDEYLEDIKGTYGDLGNIGTADRLGGSITAALFLKQFIDYPWIHLDITPRMQAIASEQLAKGSIGAGVQLLVRFLSEK